DIQREPGEFLFSSVLMLDLSGSIVESENLSKLKEAATGFIEQTMPGEEESLHGTREMAVYWFDGEEDIHSLTFFTADRDSLISSVESIDEDISEDRSTNLNGAVVQGLSLLDSRVEEIRSDEDNEDMATAGSMVLFTDGTDQADIVTTDEALDTVNNASRQHSLFTIGLGGEIDEDILKSFGTSGFELAEDSLQLNDSFLAIAQRLESTSNSYYVLEYCSPKRAGEHTLELRALYEDKFGSFETEFSAEGFTGGCSID
ncbi:MAG: vWA domain-containing protein, partial [Balneolaceae bacterium]